MPTAQLGLAIGSPVALDHVFLAVLVLVSPLVDWLWLYPRLIRATTAGVPGARARFYLAAFLTQWGFAVCAIALGGPRALLGRARARRGHAVEARCRARARGARRRPTASAAASDPHAARA